ncbi:MAG: pyrimidine/purine nucleoside phosphorylase [Methylomicrobium sp.]
MAKIRLAYCANLLILRPFSFVTQEVRMSEFSNVTVIKKANVYFNGNVNSRTIKFADGSVKTLGFMLPGEYTFNTADAELMEIIDGELEVLLPGSERAITVKGGESFNVPANSQFTVTIRTPVDYCCSFIQ